MRDIRDLFGVEIFHIGETPVTLASIATITVILLLT